MRQLVGGQPADAKLVADVIYDAATTTEPRLRWPVGDDATVVLGAKDAMSFEDFEAAMRITLDWDEFYVRSRRGRVPSLETSGAVAGAHHRPRQRALDLLDGEAAGDEAAEPAPRPVVEWPGVLPHCRT